VAAIEPDAVLTFGCAPAAYYTARAPLFLYMDGVYRYKWMVYDWLSPRAIPPFELANIDNVDRRGLSHCTKALFTSAIITKACADLYPAFRDKMRPVGIGANVESGNLPSPRPPIDRALNLLFISTNFARKGGEVAIQVARALRTQFHDVTLHIVGDSPSDRLISAADPVVIHGWLDKTIPADRARFSSLLERIHVHLLPTRGDLSPHAICEMNALGVPTVAREIGGIGDLVKAGESGELLDDLAPDRWTSAVVRVIADYDRYSRNARDVYLREQNWPIVAARIAGEIHEELAVARASTAGARPRPVPAGGRRTAGA
jgi:glycosyltransferase involved in cell wall biosynthesis